jgi:hypothetical protein
MVSPTRPPILKLFNFDAITSWRQGRHERLHGKSMEFRPGYSMEKVHCVWKESTWAESDFRCLHLCFVPRSPLDEKGNGRSNPSELMKANAFLRRAGRFLRLPRIDSGRKHSYKERCYARGPLRAVDIAAFGRPSGAELTPKLVMVE